MTQSGGRGGWDDGGAAERESGGARLGPWLFRVSAHWGLALREAFEAERARWALWVPVAFGCGIACYFGVPSEPGVLAAWCWPVGAASLMLASRGTGLKLALLLLEFAGLGFALAKSRTEWVRAPVLERPLWAVEVKGTVALVEPRPGGGNRLTLRDLEIAGREAGTTPRLARIRVLRPGLDLKPGMRVRLTARLSPPQGPALPGGYDFARTAWFWGLGATGFALRAPQIIPAGDPPRGVFDQALKAMRDGIEETRQAIGRRIGEALPGELGGLATALLTGERGGISEETTDAFRDSGLLHILSISGLHMVVMAGAVYGGVRALLALVPGLALSFPIRRWAAAAASVAAFGYLLLSGASIATVRAYIMIAIMLLAVMMDRPALALRNVAAAALLILVLMPESLLDPGFQMSFACVVALISAYELLRRLRASDGDETPDVGALLAGLRRFIVHLRDIVAPTLIASLAVAPFAVYHFHKSQQYALIANLIAIPISNLIVMPAGLLTLLAMPFGLEALPLAIMSLGLEGMRSAAEWVAGLPGAVVRVSAIPDLAFGAMVAGGLWLCLWEGRWRLLGIAGLAAGLALAPWHDVPLLLAGEGGRIVAVRGESGALRVLAGSRGDYVVTQWLEHDGDEREAKAAREESGFLCDEAGCAVRGPSLGLVAVARHERALEDDCRIAEVLIAEVALPKSCPRPRLVIDGKRLYRTGPVAVYADEGAALLRVVTSRDMRGVRPWAGGDAIEPGLHEGRRETRARAVKPSDDEPSGDGDDAAP